MRRLSWTFGMAALCVGCTAILGIDAPRGDDDDAPPVDGGGDPVDASNDVDGGGLGPDAASPGELFTAQPLIQTGVGVRAVAAGDLNEDGFQDLVVVNRMSNDISILRGLGNGNFMPQSDIAVGMQPNAVVIADYGGDGSLDIIVGTVGDLKIHVIANNPMMPGVLGGPLSRASAVVDPKGMMAGDVNGDGRLDVVICSPALRVFTQNAGGNLDQGPSIENGGGAVPECGVAAGLLSGDARVDLVGAAGSGRMTPQDGTMAGTFLMPVELTPPGATYTDAAVARVNDDALDDIVFAAGAAVQLVRQDPAAPGTFLAPVAITPPIAAGSPRVAVGALGGMSALDVALVSEMAGTLWVFVDVSAAPSYAVGFEAGGLASPSDVVVAELNGDGKPDLVVAVSNGVVVFESKP